MTEYVEKSKESTKRKNPKPKYKPSKINTGVQPGYKLKVEYTKSIAFLFCILLYFNCIVYQHCTVETKFISSYPFKKHKKMKYLGVNVPKYMHDLGTENYRILMK